MLEKYFLFKFIFLLNKKWEEYDAFSLGLIDGTGKLLKRPSTYEEKQAASRFNMFVWNIKKIIEKAPLGKTSLGKLALSLFMLREEYGIDPSEQLKEFVEFPSYTQAVLFEEGNHIELLGYVFDKDFNLVTEDVMTTGIDMSQGVRKKERVIVEPDESFASSAVFVCDPDTFTKCKHGRQPREKYKTYLGKTDVTEKIRNYAKMNPSKDIIVKDASTGGMFYLTRRGKNV